MTRQRKWRRFFRTVLLGGAAVTAGLILGGCANEDPDSASQCPPEECVLVGVGEPIYIGLLLNEGSASGQDTAGTVELAVDYLDGEFNGIAGTIEDHPVVLLESPESCTADSGIAAARLLLDQPDLVAVIGTTCSASAFQAAVPLLSEARVLTVSPTNTSPQLTNVDNRARFYFRTAINDLIQATVVADFAATKLDVTSVAALSYDDAYSEPMAQSFLARAATLGVTVIPAPEIEREQTVLTEASLAAAVGQLRDNPPQFIFLPMTEEPCIQAFRAVKAEPALAGSTVLVSEACQRPGFAATFGEAAQGVYASGPDFEDLESNPFFVEEFRPAYQRYVADRPPLVSTAASFDAANLVLAAIRQSSTALPGGRLLINRLELREAMVKVTGYPGLSGVLDCTPLGDCVRSSRVSIYQEPDWPVLNEASTPIFTQSLELAEVVTSR
jgi:branched-chain amino acid transport system substrate-binding protein